MNYKAAISDYFKSPKWTMNTLLGAVHVIIPVVGPMALAGWLLSGFLGRSDDRAETFPDLTFDKFVPNLQRGLWPFLVSLVVFAVAAPIIIIIVAAGLFVINAVAGNDGGALAIIGFAFLGLAVLAVLLVLALLAIPMYLRSALLQDFGAGLNFAFVKRFLELTKMELALTLLFMFGLTIPIIILVFIPCLGVLLLYAVIPTLSFAWIHLLKQLYQVYLSRGGEALPLSPKLIDTPPGVPPAVA